MGAYSGPEINNSGLLFSLDATNIKCVGNRKTSVLDINFPAWAVGSGSATDYGQNGDGNSRIVDANPWGYDDILWDVSDQDAASDADGGWNTSLFSIDPTKMYRFSTWMRRKTIGNGTSYLGTRGYDASSSHIGVLTRASGAVTTNPYFRAQSWWGNANDWYLIVGHVWAAGSGTGSVHSDSAIYDVSGGIIVASTDFVWQANNTQAMHRSYLYYSTDISTNQQFYRPRVDIVDGSEPSIIQLLNGYDNQFDATRRTSNVTLQKCTIDSDGIVFTGGDDLSSVVVPLATSFNKQEGTISCWLYPYSYNASNGIFINRDVTTANALDWFWLGSWNSGSLLYLRIADGVSAVTQDLTLSTFSTTHAPINQWTHLTATWKINGTSVLYINGDLKNSRAVSNIPNTNPSATGRIGLGHDSVDTGSWNGKINQFNIFNRQMTTKEVRELYLSSKGRYAA